MYNNNNNIFNLSCKAILSEYLIWVLQTNVWQILLKDR